MFDDDDRGKAMTTTSVSDACRQAAEAAAFTYRFDGYQPIVQPVGDTPFYAVIVPELKRVECAFDAMAEFRSAIDDLTVWRNQGCDVWALVPLQRMGEAHAEFREIATHVQGWWERQGSSVAFTTPEVI